MTESSPSDPALEALFDAGFPRKPVDELRANVQREVEACLSSSDPSSALWHAHELAERALHQIERERRHLKTVPRVACRAGCSSCCFLRVEVTAAEAELLWPLVRDLELLDKVRATSERVSGLDRLARLRERVPCALLSEAGSCLVHERRPFACRAANSLDEKACEAHVASANVLGEVPIDPVPFAVQRATALGFGSGLRSHGLPAVVGELHAMLCACQGPGRETR
ncbi:MAG TPA: YkgJ family cysteine cluster protein [Polyangiaceae bacterium]|nr:YkgJ family cysteine cluster protein [Polyangiaceae bacterium]